MSRVIDVSINFDTETILKKFPNPSKDPNRPTFIPPEHIYMVTYQDNVIAGQAGGELHLRGRVGDVVRWREQSISFGFEQSVILYAFVCDDPKHQLLEDPRPLRAKVQTAVPNANNKSVPTCQINDNYYWRGDLLAQGKVTYHFKFMIVDRDCKCCGYFEWDPFITITN
ncbi:inclusion body family protein [Pseudomonas donghuensis]|uniref:inclusion body family protein n=1 Tax=Pseudomonas donghuensis TaxID=1163398 RepID=UPI00029A8C8B|nr:inclusion body family protein [Pseudomonas donghuensis]WSE83843.1 inclusion body family protein [Pseudomonas donghuensis]